MDTVQSSNHLRNHACANDDAAMAMDISRNPLFLWSIHSINWAFVNTYNILQLAFRAITVGLSRTSKSLAVASFFVTPPRVLLTMETLSLYIYIFL